jgi:glutathione S-transferase
MLHLYDSTFSGNAWKVRLLLSHLATPYKRTTMSLADGPQRQPEFLARNPLARIPVLELDNGECLFESGAILCYLAEGTEYLPASGLDRARVFQWMFFEQADHLKPLARARFFIKLAGKEAEMAGQIAQWHQEGDKALQVMEGHLASHDFMAAGRYTIADVALYPYTAMCEEGKFDLGRYPSIRKWIARVEQQKGYEPLLAG